MVGRATDFRGAHCMCRRVADNVDMCEQVKGLCMVPKRAVNVMDCEVTRLILLSLAHIIPLPYHVPRKVSPYRILPL